MDATRQPGRPRKPRPQDLAGQLGQVIEQLRKQSGLDTEALAARAGLGVGTVIRVERGRQSATLDTVLALAHALGRSGAELLAVCPDWTQPPPQ